MAKPGDAEVTAATASALEEKVAAIQSKLQGTEVTVSPVKDKESAPVKLPEPVLESKTDESGGKKDDEVILPSGHRRAALARGWTTEEIDHYLETNPEEAKAQFKETFGEWQKENSEWSARGRELLAASKKAKESEGSEPGKSPAGSSSLLTKFDAQALIDEHGNEEFVKALVAPLNAMVDKINVALGQVSESQKVADSSRTEALATEAQEFLMGEGMKAFREMYGTEVKDLTEEQFKTRMNLFAEADGIVAGATCRGVSLSVRDALTRAHAIVSEGTRDAGIRESIRASLQKRTKTVQTPHQKASPADAATGEISDAELVARTDARLQQLRNKQRSA